MFNVTVVQLTQSVIKITKRLRRKSDEFHKKKMGHSHRKLLY